MSKGPFSIPSTPVYVGFGNRIERVGTPDRTLFGWTFYTQKGLSIYQTTIVTKMVFPTFFSMSGSFSSYFGRYGLGSHNRPWGSFPLPYSFARFTTTYSPCFTLRRHWCGHTTTEKGKSTGGLATGCFKTWCSGRNPSRRVRIRTKKRTSNFGVTPGPTNTASIVCTQCTRSTYIVTGKTDGYTPNSIREWNCNSGSWCCTHNVTVKSRWKRWRETKRPTRSFVTSSKYLITSKRHPTTSGLTTSNRNGNRYPRVTSNDSDVNDSVSVSFRCTLDSGQPNWPCYGFGKIVNGRAASSNTDI